MQDTSASDGFDPVIDAYKRDIDRSLLRENLKRTPEQRLLKLQDFVNLPEEVLAAGRKAGLGR
jgi:hypothetical protein